MTDPQSPLKLLVLGGAVVCAAGLAWQGIRTRRFGRRPDPSVPSGSAAGGIFYAFGPGMAPWAKESARAHLATWFAGVFYHLGAFTALFLLGLMAAGIPLPVPLTWLLRAVLAAGLAAGLGLLAKRLVSPALVPISCPDDFASNLMVDGFLVFALAAAWGMLTAGFAIWGTALLLYIPFGKIRHCFFFFYTRILFGRWFGRRGVFSGSKA